MLEKEIEKTVCDYAKEKGIISYKFSSPNHVGVPDRIFFADGGIVFLVEFKRKGEKMTPMQLREGERIGNRGTDVYLIDSVEDGKRLIDFQLMMMRSMAALKSNLLSHVIGPKGTTH